MAMCQAFAPLLIASRGLIIQIASLAAVTPYVFGSVYCASKAALVAYSRCLKLELAPFGVRVSLAMTGTVRSNTASQPKRALPPDSLYQRVRELFEKRLTWSQSAGAAAETCPQDVYVRKVVEAALRPERPAWLREWFGRPDWIWAGGLAAITYLGSWAPYWITDAVCYRKFELAKLEAALKMEEAQKKSK